MLDPQRRNPLKTVEFLDGRAAMGGQRFWRYMLIWALLVGTIWFGDRFVRGVLLTADEPRAVTSARLPFGS